MSAADEWEVPPFCTVGACIKAVGFHAGTHKLFTATVTSIRDRFPKIVVEFTSDETGSTHPLALPTPKIAYVHAGMVEMA